MDESWISWFCSLAGNQFFCEIDKGYIDDAFNLFGLKQHFPKDYNNALDTILDRIGPSEAESEELSRSAALLFGLIHARYIVTSHGLEVMHRKFVLREFGECPRTYCRGQATLPMGFTDEPKHGAVKLFCPRCQDVYNCQTSQRHIDGAFFGPTFPNLFMMSFDELVPEPPIDRYVPRIFGFKIHSSSRGLPITKSRVHRGGTPSTGAEVWATASLESSLHNAKCKDSIATNTTLSTGNAVTLVAIAAPPVNTGAAVVGSQVMSSSRKSSLLLTRQQAETRYKERLAQAQQMQQQSSHDNVCEDTDDVVQLSDSRNLALSSSSMGISMGMGMAGSGVFRSSEGLLGGSSKKRVLPLTTEQIAQHNSVILQTETETGTGTGTETGTEVTASGGLSAVASWLRSREFEQMRSGLQDSAAKRFKSSE